MNSRAYLVMLIKRDGNSVESVHTDAEDAHDRNEWYQSRNKDHVSYVLTAPLDPTDHKD